MPTVTDSSAPAHRSQLPQRIGIAVAVVAVLVFLASKMDGSGGLVHGGEATLILPDLSTVSVFGASGRSVLMLGLLVCALGLGFGVLTFRQLRALDVEVRRQKSDPAPLATLRTWVTPP